MSATSNDKNQHSRLEIDIRRLLASCEKMAQNPPDSGYDWRLVKYLQTLDEMLMELQKRPVKPSKDVTADYNRRHNFLKGLIQMAQLKNPAQKVVAAQHLPHGAAITESNTATKEIHQKTTSKYNQELKSELLGNDYEDTLRHRNISKPPIYFNNGTNGADDLDSILQYHHGMQEKVAENMLMLTKNLKEQTQLASKIIKKDTEVLKASSNLTESNMSLLSKEHETLKEHNSRACKCWLWLIIALVMFTFISMVLLMKIFKKRTV